MLSYTYTQESQINLPELLENIEDVTTGILIDASCNGDSIMTAYTGTRLETFIENIKEYIDKLDDHVSLSNFLYLIAAEEKDTRDASLEDIAGNENEYLEEIIVYTTQSDFPMFKNSRIVKLKIPESAIEKYQEYKQEAKHEDETVEELLGDVKAAEEVNSSLNEEPKKTNLSDMFLAVEDKARQKLLIGIQEIVDKMIGKGERRISMNTILRTSMYFDGCKDDCNINSFFTEVEIKFKVNINPSVRENITTVGKLVNFLIERVDRQ